MVSGHIYDHYLSTDCKNLNIVVTAFCRNRSNLYLLYGLSMKKFLLHMPWDMSWVAKLSWLKIGKQFLIELPLWFSQTMPYRYVLVNALIVFLLTFISYRILYVIWHFIFVGPICMTWWEWKCNCESHGTHKPSETYKSVGIYIHTMGIRLNFRKI